MSVKTLNLVGEPFLDVREPILTFRAAASTIPVTRPGHDFDCVQAPMRLVACRTALSIVENGTHCAPVAAAAVPWWQH